MLKIGHRGACGYAPENTIRSFEHAIGLNVDMVEFDVQRCLSGELVVIHDESLERTTNGTGLVEHTPFLTLRTLDAGGGERVPSLTEVLDRINRRVKVNIELKCTGVSELVASIIRYYVEEKGWQYNDFLVSSFKYRQLKSFKKLEPRIPLAAIVDEMLPSFFWTHLKELGVYSVHTSIALLRQGVVEKAHKRGIKVFVFTANTPENFREIAPYNVDGMFSDYPDRIG